MKDRKVQSMGQFAIERSEKLSRQFAGTWRVVVEHALRKLGGKARLKDIYREVFAAVDPGPTKHPEDRIRATLQTHFRSHGEGVWGVVELASAA